MTPIDRARMWAEELARDEVPLESLRGDLVRFLNEIAAYAEGAVLARQASTEQERAAVVAYLNAESEEADAESDAATDKGDEHRMVQQTIRSLIAHSLAVDIEDGKHLG